MICTSYEYNAKKPGGVGEMILLADTKPETMPMTTAGIKGLPAVDVAIPAGSLCVVVDEGGLYVMNEAGTAWGKWGGE